MKASTTQQMGGQSSCGRGLIHKRTPHTSSARINSPCTTRNSGATTAPMAIGAKTKIASNNPSRVRPSPTSHDFRFKCT